MVGVDSGQVSLLSWESRAVLHEVDRLASAGRDIDASTKDLLTRVHDDLLALIDLLERSGDGHAGGCAGGPGCRVFPGEI
jgi:hypothetical protein